MRHDVGTANLFDETDPLVIAAKNQTFQNPGNPPDTPTNSRRAAAVLSDYITPVLNDLWNTAPYLHDGSAHTLLDVVRSCNPSLDDCLAGRARTQPPHRRRERAPSRTAPPAS